MASAFRMECPGRRIYDHRHKLCDATGSSLPGTAIVTVRSGIEFDDFRIRNLNGGDASQWMRLVGALINRFPASVLIFVRAVNPVKRSY